MKRINIFIFSLVLIFTLGCKKGTGGGGPTPPPPPQEESLNISIDPDPGSGIAPSLGSTYTFKLNIISKVPAQGVDINVDCKKEIDNSTVSAQSVSSISPQTPFSVSGLTPGVSCVVTVRVQSKTLSTNTATKTFKVVMK